MTKSREPKGAPGSKGGQFRSAPSAEDKTGSDISLGQQEAKQTGVPTHCTHLIAVRPAHTSKSGQRIPEKHETFVSPFSINTDWGLEELAGKLGGIGFEIDLERSDAHDSNEGIYLAYLLGAPDEEGGTPKRLNSWIVSIENDPPLAVPELAPDSKGFIEHRESGTRYVGVKSSED